MEVLIFPMPLQPLEVITTSSSIPMLLLVLTRISLMVERSSFQALLTSLVLQPLIILEL